MKAMGNTLGNALAALFSCKGNQERVLRTTAPGTYSSTVDLIASARCGGPNPVTFKGKGVLGKGAGVMASVGSLSGSAAAFLRSADSGGGAWLLHLPGHLAVSPIAYVGGRRRSGGGGVCVRCAVEMHPCDTYAAK